MLGERGGGGGGGGRGEFLGGLNFFWGDQRGGGGGGGGGGGERAWRNFWGDYIIFRRTNSGDISRRQHSIRGEGTVED